MKSMKKLVLVALVLLASVMILVGCDTNAGDSPSNTDVTTQQSPTEDGSDDNNTSTVKPEVLEYTVTFNSNGGSEVATQTVKNGKTVSNPENPTKTGFLFDGWYSDSELKNLFDFATPITGNIALYAKWQEKVTIEVTNKTFATGLAEVMQKSNSILILEEDISVVQTIQITSGDFTLDLNGHKIEGAMYPVLEIAEAVSLVIQDSGENGCITPISTASGNNGFPLGVRNKGSLTLTSGSIEVNGEYATGVVNNGDFTMTGGNVIVTGSTSDFYIELTGVWNDGTMRISGGTISVTYNGSATTVNCYGIWNNNLLYLSGNPIIKGIPKNGVSSQPAEDSFGLDSPITLVGKLSNNYTIYLSGLKAGDAVVIGGEGYILTEDDKAKFELSNKNMELVLDKEQNALVLQAKSST